jgi:GMP synthase (glutamine-hydrolysing)
MVRERLSDIMEVALLQHVQNEPGGIIEEIIGSKGVPLRRVELYETNELPPLDSSHLLVLGGPMSVNDEDEYPYLRQEKALIRDRVKQGLPVFGICLGAQLIASAGGAAVTPCEPELGWSEVQTGDTAFPGLPPRFRVFQMHGETFGLPDGAALIFRGERVSHQALVWGSALGVQFHLELTEDMAKEWTSGCRAGEHAVIMEETRRYLPESHRHCRIIASKFLSHQGAPFSWI